MATSSSTLLPFVGSWKLYFHAPTNPSWQEKDYILLATLTSWADYFTWMNAISDTDFEPGGFFLMKDGFQPRYEHFTNKRGGAYQIQISQTEDEYRKLFDYYAIGMIQEANTTDSKNKIVGLSISLKRKYYILKVWNMDAATYNKITDIHNFVKPTTSIMYASHIGRTYS
jgi:hypothetical protein